MNADSELQLFTIGVHLRSSAANKVFLLREAGSLIFHDFRMLEAQRAGLTRFGT
jgi:hypothetical protein